MEKIPEDIIELIAINVHQAVFRHYYGHYRLSEVSNHDKKAIIRDVKHVIHHDQKHDRPDLCRSLWNSWVKRKGAASLKFMDTIHDEETRKGFQLFVDETRRLVACAQDRWSFINMVVLHLSWPGEKKRQQDNVQKIAEDTGGYTIAVPGTGARLAVVDLTDSELDEFAETFEPHGRDFKVVANEQHQRFQRRLQEANASLKLAQQRAVTHVRQYENARDAIVQSNERKLATLESQSRCRLDRQPPEIREWKHEPNSYPQEQIYGKGSGVQFMAAKAKDVLADKMDAALEHQKELYDPKHDRCVQAAEKWGCTRKEAKTRLLLQEIWGLNDESARIVAIEWLRNGPTHDAKAVGKMAIYVPCMRAQGMRACDIAAAVLMLEDAYKAKCVTRGKFRELCQHMPLLAEKMASSLGMTMGQLRTHLFQTNRSLPLSAMEAAANEIKDF